MREEEEEEVVGAFGLRAEMKMEVAKRNISDGQDLRRQDGETERRNQPDASLLEVLLSLSPSRPLRIVVDSMAASKT